MSEVSELASALSKLTPIAEAIIIANERASFLVSLETMISSATATLQNARSESAKLLKAAENAKKDMEITKAQSIEAQRNATNTIIKAGEDAKAMIAEAKKTAEAESAAIYKDHQIAIEGIEIKRKKAQDDLAIDEKSLEDHRKVHDQVLASLQSLKQRL